ncbi:TPA: tetratricopeptide repeat protein [Salmonella enterica subsp. diarizonae serovar 61:l,v:z35]
MTATPSHKTDAKRDATDSIRGYVYQIYQSVLAWINLNESEILFLECAEDFDICLGQSVIGTQVKDLSGNLTLRSPEIVETLNNFWSLQQNNPHHDVTLRFLTTASAVDEKGAPFGKNQKGLEYWQKCRPNTELVEPLRSFLLTLPLNPALMEFVKSAPVDILCHKLINRIEWDLGNKKKDALQLVIEDKLKLHGSKLGINTHYSRQVLPHLLKHVADLLSTKGSKPLFQTGFWDAFESATMESVPKNELDSLRRNSGLQQFMDNAEVSEISRLLARVPTIGMPLPVVEGAVRRTVLVEKLERQLLSSQVLFLHGSSGTGKTNLAALLSDKIGGRWGWGSFRGRSTDQIREMLSRAAIEVNTSTLPIQLVLDDLDLSDIADFESELITLIFTAMQNKGRVVVTGQKQPPMPLFPKLWLSQESEQAIPYFDEQEIGALIKIHGLHDPKKISQTGRGIYYSTRGHPQLVHARVRTLSSRGWSTTIDDILRPEDVERIKEEARSRLVREFPSDAARVLAYRLSLVSGSFRRNIVTTIAGAPPPIRLPGEIFDTLVGPWIEKEGSDLYRVSPLLAGAANDTLPEDEINAVHIKIAHSIVNEKELNQYDVANAFLHAFLAKEKTILISLASQLIRESDKHLSYLRDSMSWFAEVALNPGQTIIDDEAMPELLLRLLQFKLLVSSSQEAKVLTSILKIEGIVASITPEEQKNLSTLMAYGIILANISVHIPSLTVVRLLSSMMDALDSGVVDNVSFSPYPGEYSIDTNDPVTLLFSHQAVRINGLDDLLELITSLDLLEEDKRNRLLAVCDIDTDFSNVLINQSCWKEEKGSSLDIQKALHILRLTETKAREWGARRLYKACLSNISVIYDEYEHSVDEALSVLDKADKEFKDDATLSNQRAKVLFHAERYSDAIHSFQKALLLPDFGNVDYVFACRYMGIAFAKLNDWSKSAVFFQKGAEITGKSKIQIRIRVGLMADAAVSLWRSDKKKESLLLFSDVLDCLPSIETKDDIRAHHLHATVRHCIAWVHFETIGYSEHDLVVPLPGMCSNQEPHEKIIDHRLIDISGSWGLLAATEDFLSLGDKITKRAHMATKGRMPLNSVLYGRMLALESLFREKTFDKLIPTLIGVHEGMSYMKTVEQNNIDTHEIGEIPPVPGDYWKDEASWVLNSQIVLAACITSFSESSVLPSLLNSWSDALEHIAEPSTDFKGLIAVLHGEAPGNNIYQQAAYALLALQSNSLTPVQLWKNSCRLLEVSRLVKNYTETALEALLVKRWLFASQQQKFLFSAPRISATQIERACLGCEYSGLEKVASILIIAEPYLDISVSGELMMLLKCIRDKKQ